MYVKLWYTQLLSCFVFLTDCFPESFTYDQIIQVNVSNGSTQTIWCRVAGDKALKVQGEIHGGLGVPGISFNAHEDEHVQYMAGATRGYSQIQRGNTLEFEVSTSSKSVYMTVINVSGREICKNHEITKNRNYIITSCSALVDAKQNDMWIDKDERNHKVPYDNNIKDDKGFRPGLNFSVNGKCW